MKIIKRIISFIDDNNNIRFKNQYTTLPHHARAPKVKYPPINDFEKEINNDNEKNSDKKIRLVHTIKANRTVLYYLKVVGDIEGNVLREAEVDKLFSKQKKIASAERKLVEKIILVSEEYEPPTEIPENDPRKRFKYDYTKPPEYERISPDCDPNRDPESKIFYEHNLDTLDERQWRSVNKFNLEVYHVRRHDRLSRTVATTPEQEAFLVKKYKQKADEYRGNANYSDKLIDFIILVGDDRVWAHKKITIHEYSKYLTRWMEDKELRKEEEILIASFMDHILIIGGVLAPKPPTFFNKIIDKIKLIFNKIKNYVENL